MGREYLGAALAVLVLALSLGPLSPVEWVPDRAGTPGRIAQPAQQLLTNAIVERTAAYLWRLAAAQYERDGLADRLLSATPATAEGMLESLDISTSRLVEELRSLGVVPRFAFGPLGADVIDLASRFDLTTGLLVPYAPPVELRGPAVTTLVVFGPLVPTDDPPAPRTLVAYDVHPTAWRPTHDLEHETCLDDSQSPVPLSKIFLRLTYGDGSSDAKAIDVHSSPRVGCSLTGFEKYTAIVSFQKTRSVASPPLVVATAFVVNRQEVPSLAIGVPMPVARP